MKVLHKFLNVSLSDLISFLNNKKSKSSGFLVIFKENWRRRGKDHFSFLMLSVKTAGMLFLLLV